MGTVTVFQALKRFWWVVVAFAAVGAVIGGAPDPGQSVDVITRYRASHTILVSTAQNQSLFQNPQAFNQLQLFTTTGQVPRRAADVIDFDGSPAELAAQLTVDLNQQSGALRITTTQDSAERAVQVADAFADELISYLAERQDELREERVTAALSRLQDLEAQVRAAEAAQLTDPDDAVARAQLSALSRQYGVAFEQYNALIADADTGQLVLTTLERAQPVAISQGGGLGAPRSRISRAVLAGAVGAAIGMGVALLLARADRRVRTRGQLEEVLGMAPQLVIPRTPGHHPGDLAVVPERQDPLSDSYRRLRSLLAFVHAGQRRQTTDHTAPGGSVTLILSPGAADGKTTITANLSSAFVEAGDRTIAVNADFRRPTLSRRLAVVPPDHAGLTLDEVADLDPSRLLSPVAGVDLAVLDLAAMRRNSPGDLARTTARLLPNMRELADQIVVDSSPVGATAETLELVPLADTIVLAVTLGHTSAHAARSALETVQSLASGTLLLVMIGTDGESVASDYYYAADPTDPWQRRRSWLPWRRRERAGGVNEADGAAGDADPTPRDGTPPLVEPTGIVRDR